MENNSTFQIEDGVVYSQVCQVPVLAATRKTFDETDVAASVLNESGEYIWNCLTEGQSLGEIVRNAARFFEEEETTVRTGVIDFLETLVHQHFIKVE